jgi:hypothetical protein
MSTPRDRDQLKTYLQTGDRPTQSQLWDLVDGMVNQESDNFHIAPSQDVGIGTDNPCTKIACDRKDIYQSRPKRSTRSNVNNALEILCWSSAWNCRQYRRK